MLPTAEGLSIGVRARAKSRTYSFTTIHAAKCHFIINKAFF